MLDLELIKPLPQPNWALTPFIGRPPTIEEYRKDKAKYQYEVMAAGVYCITAAKFAVHSRGDDLLLWRDPDYWAWRQLSIDDKRSNPMPCKSDMRMTIRSCNEVWTDSLEHGTISYNSGIYKFIGVFEKNGSIVHLNTLHPEAIACV